MFDDFERRLPLEAGGDGDSDGSSDPTGTPHDSWEDDSFDIEVIREVITERESSDDRTPDEDEGPIAFDDHYESPNPN